MMPRKRNKTKKDTSKKPKETSQQPTTTQTFSPLDHGAVDSKISKFFSVSPTNKNKKSLSESTKSIMKESTTNPEEEREKPGSPEERKSGKSNSNSSSPRDEQAEGRALKQTLLSPKKDSDSVPVKSRRKTKTNSSSKGYYKEDKSKESDITKYFPVRRSVRRVKSKIEEEKQARIEKAVLEGIEEGIQVRNVEGKGRGVFAVRSFQRGDLVCEYSGEHIDYETAREREKKYSEDESIGCYMYYFTFKNKKYCVDATQESGRLGRLLNHSMNGNCTTKLISIKDKPYLILVAAKDIPPGTELLYDYGERSKDAIASHPWLQA